MTLTSDRYTTDPDRWSHLTGARFVGPDDWRHGIPQEWGHDSLHLSAYTEALTLAADDNGVILNFRPNEFYEGQLSDLLRDDNDKPGWRLRYDRFTAMLLLDVEQMLLDAGYLAGRGNGDSYDRRLTLPAKEGGR